MNGFYQDILGQPAALRKLLGSFDPAGGRSLSHIPAPESPLLTGMGSSYHAALAASICLHSRGIRAQAMETSHLLYYGGPILEQCREVVYLSQSGASAEVIPFIDRLDCRRVFLAITNDTNSPLANRADHVLDLSVESESLVASKTYLNSLALLWLLIRSWTGDAKNSDLDALEDAATSLDTVLSYEPAATAGWVDFLGGASSFICAGYGPHAATALQAAQTLAEWAKMPALGLSAGALRHGFIEIAGPGIGVILFSGTGPAQTACLHLAKELSGYGARVALVEDGRSSAVAPDRSIRALDPPAPVMPPLADEFLALLLNILPVQLFSVGLAQQRGIPPGFRYLEKIVRDL